MKDGTGRPEKPSTVLTRMRRLKRLGSKMQHNHGVDFMTDAQFAAAFWGIFPQEMWDWLTNEQNKDPFEPGNHMEVKTIAGHLQRYWNMTYKKQDDGVSKEGKSGENFRGNSGVKTRKSEGMRRKNEEASDSEDGDVKTSRDNIRTSRVRDTGVHEDQGDNKRARAYCPIGGHQRYQHDWQGCFLNPHSARFDFNSAQRFYNDGPAGNDIWYRAVFEQLLAQQGQNQEQEESHFFDRGYYGNNDGSHYGQGYYGNY